MYRMNLLMDNDIDILIVEDSKLQAENLREYLENCGYKVKIALDGEMAMEYLKSIQPGLIISDVVMPGVDGYELCVQIKSIESLRNIPVILLTSLTDPKSIIMALASGADNFITKPYDRDYLISRIQYMLAEKNTGAEGGGVSFFFLGEKYNIVSDPSRIVDFVISACEDAVKKNQELSQKNEELLNVERELLYSKEKAEAYSKAKSNFISNMSLELRTPLNAIVSFSKALHNQLFGELNPKQQEHVNNILEAGNHLISLINDIHDLSKVESGKMELNISKVNVKRLMESSLVMFIEKAMKHSITLDLSIPEEMSLLEIFVDERKFNQIIFNILSNATKFTPDGGKIGVSASLSLIELSISICDTGIGIDRERLDKIFGEFGKDNSLTGRNYKGSGLSLALTRKLVELHGGRIWAESEGNGKGSTFCFTIPIKS